MSALKREQEIVYKNILNNYKFASNMLLHGPAGTGKTYLLNVLIQEFVYTKNLKVAVLSPTHKAKSILKNKWTKCESEYGLEKKEDEELCFHTIARFLNKKMVYNEKGEVDFISLSSEYSKGYDIIIVDESSMVNEADSRALIALQGTKIFTGDKYQLPPVGENIPYLFDKVKNRQELKEIIRTQDEMLQSLYTVLRDCVRNNCIDNEKFFGLESENIQILDTPEQFMKKIKKHFNMDTDKVLSYTNYTVNQYNDYIRNLIFECENSDEKLPKFIDEDIIIFNNYFLEQNENKDSEELVQLYTSDEAKILDIDIEEKDIKFRFRKYNKEKNEFYISDENYTFDLYVMRCENINNEQFIMTAIHDNHTQLAENLVNKMKKGICDYLSYMKVMNERISKDEINLIWSEFYDISNSLFPPCVYSYAMTIHKSQGSTFEKIFIDLNNVISTLSNVDINSLYKAIYTGMSRASKKIFVLI